MRPRQLNIQYIVNFFESHGCTVSLTKTYLRTRGFCGLFFAVSKNKKTVYFEYYKYDRLFHNLNNFYLSNVCPEPFTVRMKALKAALNYLNKD